MAGRAAQKALEQALVTRLWCATVGCERHARPGSRLCEDCETEQHQRASEAFCEAHGLRTVEQKRAYCARLARSFGRAPRFETWAKNITQRAVDLMLINAGEGDKQALERLRDYGAIDEQNRVVPTEERAERAQARKAQRERIEQELRERGVVA